MKMSAFEDNFNKFEQPSQKNEANKVDISVLAAKFY